MSSKTSILNSLRTIVQSLRVSSRRAERAAGISGAQLFVLAQLAEQDELSLNELAARTHTHQSSVSTVVARLVEAKLVTRDRARDDQRKLVLSLTKKGRSQLQLAPKTAQDALFAAMDELSGREQKLLAAHLEKLIELAGLDTSTPQMFLEEKSKEEKSQTKKSTNKKSKRKSNQSPTTSQVKRK